MFEVSEVGTILAATANRSAVATIREDNGGVPGEVVATLNSPSTFVDDAVNWFMAPSGETARLDPDTVYWFAFEKDPVVSSLLEFDFTRQTGEVGDYGWGYLLQPLF